MHRKSVGLVVFVLLLWLAGNSLAQQFIGGNPILKGGSWCTPANWATGVLPNSSTGAEFAVLPGATIGAGCNAVCYSVILATNNGEIGGLTIDGGNLTMTDFWVLGYLSGSTGNFTMNSGSAKCYRTYIGFVGGTGIWNQYGGTFQTSQLWLGTSAGAKGTVNLYGGKIIVEPMQFFEIGPVPQSSGLMNIAGGTLVLLGDYTGTIKRFISEGKLVAYGGNSQAALKYDYNVTTRAKTTVYAVMMSPSLAYGPSPMQLRQLGLSQQNLIWKPGNYADRHNLYFGSSADDLQEISHGQEPNSFPVSSLNVKPGHTYFWRVDEVDDSNGQVWVGDVWQFKVAEYILVDDMESYNTSLSKITVKWVGGGAISGSTISLEAGTKNCRYWAGQAMRFDYKNDGLPYKFSQARVSVAKLMTSRDWTAGGVEILTLWFRGVTSNAADQLYIKIGDGTNEAVQIYGDFNDFDGTTGQPNVNAIQEDKWHEWNIDMSRFTGVNLASVLTITIGVGKQTPVTGGNGTIYIDDIRLYPKRCLLRGGPSMGDINGDCMVDFVDFAEVADGWLDSVQ